MTKIMKSKKLHRWVKWLRWDRALRSQRKRKYLSLKTYPPVNFQSESTKIINTRLVYDFGGLVENVERFKPAYRKCFIILEKINKKTPR